MVTIRMSCYYELDRLRKDDKFNAYYCAEKVNEMNRNS